MRKYGISSRDFLKRAEALVNSNEICNLLYAALELRFGIEARLQEYLKGGEDILKAKADIWKVKHLDKEVRKRFAVNDKPVEITIQRDDTKVLVRYAYTPVSINLRSIAGKLGQFLHYIPQHRENEKNFILSLRKLVKSGIEELRFSTSGHLLGPPRFIKNGEDKDIILKYDRNSNATIFPKGVKAKLKLEVVAVRKDETSVGFKPVWQD